MNSFLQQATPKIVMDRLREMVECYPHIRTLSWIMGERLFLEWAHSLGYLSDEAIRNCLPSLPPENLRSIVSDHYPEAFLWTGAMELNNFMDIYSRHKSGVIDDPIRVFDFGCGCGRLSRFLNMTGMVEAYASDINPDHVAWCRDNLQNVTTKVNGERPPLPFQDAVFDFAYSLSIFTHLNEKAMSLWLNDLGRVMTPGGILILTTHGYSALNTIRDSAIHQSLFCVDKEWAKKMIREFEKRRFIFLPLNEPLLKAIKVELEYGHTFIHSSYAQEKWNNSLFSIVEYIPAGLRGWQDIYVLRRSNSFVGSLHS